MSKKDKILKECDGLFYEFVRNRKGTLIKPLWGMKENDTVGCVNCSYI